MVSDVLELDLKLVGEYDVVLLDPAWDDGVSSNPTRGLSITYPMIKVDQVKQIPVNKLCPVGFVPLWVTNLRLKEGIDILKTWGCLLVEVVVWVKKTSSGKLWHSHGQFLRYNKEILVFSVRGKSILSKSRSGDVIMSKVRQQSRKPDEVYQLLERLNPDARYLKLFGRRWNCR
eukprot:snap_masked-scaffold_48-processed-gene-1.91-mRNA-1 protein AED:1.00 eAED:1.00 QI:0/-1/0/0/-1/1/1/0/173